MFAYLYLTYSQELNKKQKLPEIQLHIFKHFSTGSFLDSFLNVCRQSKLVIEGEGWQFYSQKLWILFVQSDDVQSLYRSEGMEFCASWYEGR